MSEEWRRKKFYGPRILIPVDEVLDSAFGDCLVCLTGGQLNLVRNLLGYATRRTTYVSEYFERFYMTPTTEEWDALQAVVADLEGRLMNCDQFTADMAEILSWLRSQGSLTPGPFTEGEAEAFPYDDVVGDDELTPAEEDACAIAQLWFEWGYQVITEHVLPATRFGFDYLVPAVTAFIVGAIGGPAAVLGVYVVAELIQELLEVLYNGAETNLISWMMTNKQAIVCALYLELLVGGDASDIWATAEASVVDPAEDISAGDKLILHLFMGSWAGSNALRAFEAVTEWATSNVIPGYCTVCSEADFILAYNFPPCPQGWLLFSPAYCNGSGYMSIWNPHGDAVSPEFADLRNNTWDIHCYIEFSSNLGNGDRCGTLYCEQKDTSAAPWAECSPSQKVPLYSIGGGWTSATTPVTRNVMGPLPIWRLRVFPYAAGAGEGMIVVRKVYLFAFIVP